MEAFEPVETFSRKLRAEMAEIQNVAVCTRQLQEIAMNGGSLKDAVRLLAGWCRGMVWVRDPAGRILGRCEEDVQTSERTHENRITGGRLVYERPIVFDGRDYGMVMLSRSDRQADRDAMDLIDGAVAPLLMILMQTHLSENARQREDLLSSLMLGRMTLSRAVLEQAAALGIDLTQPHTVCVYRTSGRPAAQTLDDLQEAVREHVERLGCCSDASRMLVTEPPLLVRLPDCVAHLHLGAAEPDGSSPVEAACRRLHSDLCHRAQPAPFSIGISRPRADAESIAMGCLEARRAAETGERILGSCGVYRYDQLAMESILSQLLIDDETCLFVETELGVLLDDDPRSQLLLATLEELLAGPSHQDMASRLLVHPKTITHRKLGIEKLLGKSLDDSGTRQRLSLALALYRLNRGLWPGKET